MRLGLDRLDKILYINLPHRQDREERLLSELQRVGANMSRVERIEAIYDPLNGHRGCALSHIKALEKAKEDGCENVLILEDDFVFTDERVAIDCYIDTFFSAMQNCWDVLLLSAHVIDYDPTHHKTIKRVKSAQLAHSYAVNSPYMQALIDCFKFAHSLMGEDVFFVHSQQHAIDQVWKLLQPHGKWYVGSNTIGTQGASYTDTGLDHIKRFVPQNYP